MNTKDVVEKLKELISELESEMVDNKSFEDFNIDLFVNDLDDDVFPDEYKNIVRDFMKKNLKNYLTKEYNYYFEDNDIVWVLDFQDFKYELHLTFDGDNCDYRVILIDLEVCNLFERDVLHTLILPDQINIFQKVFNFYIEVGKE